MLELFVLSGPDAGRSCGLKPGDVIGRAEGLALRLGDRSISRQHARIEQRGTQLILIDLSSTNGLHLDEERVGEIQLVDFLEFKAGDVLIRARLSQDSDDQVSLLEPKQAAQENEPEVSFAFGGGAVTSAPKPAPASEPEIEIEWDQAELAPPAEKTPASLRDEQRAALLGDLQSKQSGLLSADLSQYPGWIQALVGVLVLGFGAGICYGMYLLVIGARS